MKANHCLNMLNSMGVSTQVKMVVLYLIAK